MNLFRPRHSHHGYSHLSGIEMISRQKRCFQSWFRPDNRCAGGFGMPGSPLMVNDNAHSTRDCFIQATDVYNIMNFTSNQVSVCAINTPVPEPILHDDVVELLAPEKPSKCLPLNHSLLSRQQLRQPCLVEQICFSLEPRKDGFYLGNCRNINSGWAAFASDS